MVEKTTKKQEIKTLVGTRGRTFQGLVTKSFGTRAVVELERTVRVPKFERFAKKKTKLHARVPEGMEVAAGDYVEVRECRPLSKMIRFVIVKMVRKANNGKEEKQ